MPSHNNNNWIFVMIFQLTFHFSEKIQCLLVNQCYYCIIISLFSILPFYKAMKRFSSEETAFISANMAVCKWFKNGNWANSIMHNNLLWDFNNIGRLHCTKNISAWICIWRELQIESMINDIWQSHWNHE